MSLANFTTEYLNHPSVSNSELGYFIQSPYKFSKYKSGQYEETSSGYYLGDIIHKKVLEPDTFNDLFIYQPENVVVPSREDHTAFADTIIAGFTPEESYDSIFKGKGKVREDKIAELVGKYTYYIEFKKTVGNRQIITLGDQIIIDAAITSLKDHRGSHKLLFEQGEHLIGLNEKEIMGYEVYGIKWKSKIDRILVNIRDRVIDIIDLKTTGKPIHTFPYSYMYYNYHRQQALYAHAAVHFLSKVNVVDDLQGYVIRNKCVAVETNDPFEARVFRIHPEIIQRGDEEIEKYAGLLAWHSENKEWFYTKTASESRDFADIIDAEAVER